MIYAYRCPACGLKHERDVPVQMRNEEKCVCGASLRRQYQLSVVIPRRMRAGHDDVIRQIMPQGPEWPDGGKEERKKWLRAAVEQGVEKRYRHDLEG